MAMYMDADIQAYFTEDEIALINEYKDTVKAVDFKTAILNAVSMALDKQFWQKVNLREVMNSTWISVSEGLPKVDAECIISLDNSIELATFTGEDFHAEWCDYEIAEVKAWMPSPEPYKADKWGDFPYKGENIPQGNGLP